MNYSQWIFRQFQRMTCIVQPTLIEEINSAARLNGPYHSRDRINDKPNAIFVFSQCIFGLFKFGDVDLCSVPLNDPPQIVTQRNNVHEKPTIVAIGSLATKLSFQWFARLQSCAPLLYNSGKII